MLQTEYIRSLNCNYERILLENKPEEKRYQYCILNRGGIKNLLPCSLRYINGLVYLYYDISSRQNIMQLYGGRSISRKWVLDFVWGIRQVEQELDRFLLDVKNIIWYPEQIFQSMDNNVFSFLYLPYSQEQESFKSILEFLTEHIDYQDEGLVECVYHMYEQYERTGTAYLQKQLYEDVRVLEGAEETTKELPQKPVENREYIAEEPEDREEEVVTPKKGILTFFEGRKKKNKEIYTAPEVKAVAESTHYEEAYGETLYVETGESEQGKIRGLYLPDGTLLKNLQEQETLIGKKREEADIVLEDASVSRVHAKITKEREYYYLEDMNSTNGTFKNGLRLQPYEKRRLEEGDDIRCGRVLFVFR